MKKILYDSSKSSLWLVIKIVSVVLGVAVLLYRLPNRFYVSFVTMFLLKFLYRKAFGQFIIWLPLKDNVMREIEVKYI